MALQSLPSAAERYGEQQRAEIGAAVRAVARRWRSMGDDFDSSWRQVGPQLLAILDMAQERIAAEAVEYVPEVLAATSPRAARRTPEYVLQPWSLIGTDGAGLATDTLIYRAVIEAKVAVRGGATAAQALSQGGQFLTRATGTLLSDTGRTAEKVAAGGRGVTTFVRMLQPPSCGRCVILAGKRTRRQEAFQRHPGCDCRNIPAAESVSGDLVSDPREYLDALDDRGLAKALGSTANARAYRDGADPGQIVNSYRRQLTSDGYVGGVRPAQLYGRSVKYTTEGTTRRGLANWRMRQSAAAQAGLPARAPRLMPESIYKIATDAADAKRLLRLYGWIL